MDLLRASALLVIAAPLAAQSHSVVLPPPHFLGGSAPAFLRNAMELSGLVLLTTGADLTIRHLSQTHQGATLDALGNVGNALGDPTYLAPGLLAGFLVGGLTDRPQLRSTVVRAVKSAVVATIATRALKLAIGRARPYQEKGMADFHPFGALDASMPSGHTTLAFAVAATLAQDTRSPWLDALWYGGATTTAFARIHDDQHWFSDVVAGAIIGTVSAQMLARHEGRITPTVAAHQLGVQIIF